VPAQLTCFGVNSTFTDPVNWTGGQLPTAGDDLYFDGNAIVLPPPGSPPGTPTNDPNTSTTFVTGTVGGHYFPDNYAGIHLVNHYAGTITIPFDITFGDYEQSSGNTSNPGTNGVGSDIRATSAFSWTGGNINVSSDPGVLHIQGVPLGIIGTDTSNISTGSKISIETNGANIGSYVTAKGILNLVSEFGIEVMVNCTLLLQAAPGGAPQQVKAPNPKATILTKGNTICLGSECDPGYILDGGNLSVMAGGLKTTGKVEPDLAGSPSVKVVDGVLGILNNQTLTTTHGVDLRGGWLRTYTSNQPVLQQANIVGELTVFAGDIDLGLYLDNTFHTYSRLHVTGRVRLFAGFFHAYFNANDATQCCQIFTDEKMVFSANNGYLVFVHPIGGQPGANLKWKIFEAAQGFVDDDNPAITPGYNVGRTVDGKGIEIW
jgi:hypothetical protein